MSTRSGIATTDRRRPARPPSQNHARAVITPIVESAISRRHIRTALAATPRNPSAAALPGHAVRTTAGIVATGIPGMGCRLDADVITGCTILPPRTPAAIAAGTTPSNVVSAVSTTTTRVSKCA